MNRMRRAVVGTLVVGLLSIAPGCAAFNDGIADSLENDRAEEDDYAWYHELYEFPLGLIGFPLFLALSPGLYWIPGGDEDEFGYPLGRAFGGDFIYIDPTENYR